MRAALLTATIVAAGLGLPAAALGQSPSGAAPGPVERRELPPLDAPGSRPVAAPGIAALPPSLWQGMDFAELSAVVAALPLPHPSPVLQALIGQAMATAAPPPAGVAADAFDAFRLGVLYRAGLVGQAVRAGEALGGRGSASAAGVLARALLATGNAERACAQAAGIGADAPQAALREALVVRIYCDVARKDATAAALSVALAREHGVEAPFLFAVVDAMAGGSANAAATSAPARVEVEDHALLQLAGVAVGRDVVATAAPALLALLARTGEGEVRLLAAERGARLNVVTPPALAEAYRARDQGAGREAERARLLHRAEAATAPQERARALQAAAAAARAAGLQHAAAPALVEALGGLAAEADLAWFAGTALRLTALAGAPEQAAPWLALAGERAAGDAVMVAIAAGREAEAAGPAMRLATVRAVAGGWDATVLHHVATLLDALGHALPIPLWEAASRAPQPARGRLPETGLLSRLAAAAERRETGRVILLAAAALGPQGPPGAHMIALGDTVRALRAVGLDAPARRVAHEALDALLPPPESAR